MISNHDTKILVILPNWVGDIVLAQSLLRHLKETPCQIDVLVPSFAIALAERMPEIDSIIATNFQHGKLSLFRRLKAGLSLRKNNYSQAIVLTNSWKSAIIPWMANIPKRTGFLGELRWGLLNDIHALKDSRLANRTKTVEQFLFLGWNKQGTFPALPSPALTHKKPTFKFIDEQDTFKVALCIGAEYGSAKRWLYFAELANLLLTQKYEVILLGTKSESALADEIQQKTDVRCRNLVGKTTLGEVVDILASCDVAVSNDSGLLHISAAVNTPLLAIYGSSSPHKTPPMSENVKIFWLGLPCSPCFQRTCSLHGDKHLRCLKDISAETVFAQIKNFHKFAPSHL